MKTLSVSIVIRSLEYPYRLNREIAEIIGDDDEVINVYVRQAGQLYLNTRFINIQKDCDRLQASYVAAEQVSKEYILIVDSDQDFGQSLMDELKYMNYDMVIIPERSAEGGLGSYLMDLKRRRLEYVARKSPNAIIRAIPRYYRASIYVDAISRMREYGSKYAMHEDSFVYTLALEMTNNIGFATNCILNYGDNLFQYARKSFEYGKIIGKSVETQMGHFSIKMDSQTFFGRGIETLTPIDFIRLFPYLFGIVYGLIRKQKH